MRCDGGKRLYKVVSDLQYWLTMSFSAEYHVHNVPALHDAKCYMYNETLPSIMPLLVHFFCLANCSFLAHFFSGESCGRNWSLPFRQVYCSRPGTKVVSVVCECIFSENFLVVSPWPTVFAAGSWGREWVYFLVGVILIKSTGTTTHQTCRIFGDWTRPHFCTRRRKHWGTGLHHESKLNLNYASPSCWLVL